MEPRFKLRASNFLSQTLADSSVMASSCPVSLITRGQTLNHIVYVSFILICVKGLQPDFGWVFFVCQFLYKSSVHSDTVQFDLV